MRKLRWGILSTANIGVQKVIPAMQRGELCEVVAIASRDTERAQSVAKRLGIPASHGSYENLLADPAVEAIYNPLPNHLHVPWSIKALEAGKHVLCEKPISLSAAEAQCLIAAAEQHPQLKVMEAFMYRFHPQWERTKQIIAEGGVGTVRTVQTFFSYFNSDPDNIRNQKDLGGGALMDIGCYCISLARFLFDAAPRRVCGLIEHDPQSGIDRLSSGMLDFGAQSATFTCSTQLVPYQRMNVFGAEGRVEIEIPFNAPPDKPCKLWHTRAGATEEITFPVCDQYTLQGDAFARAVLDDAPVPTPLADALDNMRVIDALVASARQDTWVAI